MVNKFASQIWFSPQEATASGGPFAMLAPAAGIILFTTDTNFVGITKHRTSNGDSILIRNRGDIPYLARKAGKFWRFDECAYVHGVMNEEVWPENGTSLEEFTFV